MRHDPKDWKAFKKGQTFTPPASTTIRLSQPGAIYAGGNLLKYCTEISVQCERGTKYTATEDGVYKERQSSKVECTGKILTNRAGLPMKSPAEDAVTLSLRRLKKREAEMNARFAEETDKMEAKRAEILAALEPKPKLEPNPEEKPEEKPEKKPDEA